MHAHPNEISFGADRADLERFNDLHELNKLNPPYTIHEIVVEANDKHLLGIEFKYIDNDGKKHTGHNAIKHKHGKHHKHVFTIDAGDEIKEIDAWIAGRIDGLKFTTYKGKSHLFGVQEGEHTHFKFHGCTFGGVQGGYQEHLDFLTFQVHPVPEKNKGLVGEKHQH